MITIDLEFLEPLTELFSKRHDMVEVETGTTLSRFLEDLYAHYSDDFARYAINTKSDYMVVMLNGKIVQRKFCDFYRKTR